MLRPKDATSQVPVVVPRLAPMTTPKPVDKGIIPAAKKEIANTITKVLDCTSVVLTKPKPIECGMERVTFCRVSSIKPPLRVCTPRLSIQRPNKNTAMPAAIFSKFGRSEEHTSELKSRPHLVCRLLLEK